MSGCTSRGDMSGSFESKENEIRFKRNKSFKIGIVGGIMMKFARKRKNNG